ncbi:MAG: hypothetical protein JWQ14_2663 [Adhaeribacter sp.]|nr:hypothetical protein [Adhaeribacter sp.]
MTTTSDREQKFIKYWVRRRTNKWQFIWRFTAFWVLLAAIPSYLFRIDFKLAGINYAELLFTLFFYALMGFLYSRWSFKINERRYINLTDRDPAEIIKAL